uniref:Uncharacterized protein n=1 Tax=Anguilla anguilla TaxID=7936 RepID=A0A0E9VF99_ANGAN
MHIYASICISDCIYESNITPSYIIRILHFHFQYIHILYILNFFRIYGRVYT